MDCIYLSAGLGVRMKESQPKQFLTLLGKPIFMYALEVLEQMPSIGRILLVYHVDYKDLYLRYLDRYNISKVELVEGGRSRQQSVFNGLLKVSTKRVLIHEAARPFITSESILEMIAMEKEIAVIPTIPIPYTVSTGGDYMDGILDRGRLHNVQLPQIFSTAALTTAHERARSDHFEANEDGVLIFRNGGQVRFISGSENNIKITTPLDLIIAEKMIRGVYQ